MNDVVKRVEQKIGPFKYNADDDIQGVDLMWRGPIELDNGSVY